MLGSQPTTIGYNDVGLFTTSTTVNCGNLVLTFLDSNDQAIDSAVFTEDRSNPNLFYFYIGAGPLVDENKAGDHLLKFKIYFSQAPSNSAESSNFLVQIIDPCDAHIAWPAPVISVPAFLPQTYVLTKTAKIYQIPEFLVSPSICQGRLTYSFDPNTDSSPSVVGVNGPAATFNSGSRTFTFLTDEVNLAGSPPNEDGRYYQLTVTASLPQVSQTGQVVLIIKNPCYDSTYINVVPVSTADFTYTLYKVAPDNQWTYSTFEIVAETTAIANLCGPLSYSLNAGAIQSSIQHDTVNN